MKRPSIALCSTLCILYLSLLTTACGDGSAMGPVEEIEGLPRALSQSEEMLVDAGNDFAFDFLQRAYQAEPRQNLFVAPLSASMALGMTMNGTAGTTFDEMSAALGFGEMSLEEINQGYRDLIDLLKTLDGRVELGIGNSIWYREGFPVRSDFLTRVETSFDAAIRELDFSTSNAVGVINNWVKEQTRGTIEEIVENPIDAATVMFLINAIYFKGDWTARFEEGKTADATWIPWSSMTQPTVPLMQVADTFAYAETEEYQAVDLPYGGKAFSMTVVLPRPGHSIEDLVASMDRGRWSQIVGSLAPRAGQVFLPRFRMEWEMVLNQLLQDMGMNAAFTPGEADFTRMSDLALYISKVKQKTFVDVNEKGTEASGVTVVEIRLVSAHGQPFQFRADHPFLFVIRERFSGTILFAGVLMTPP